MPKEMAVLLLKEVFASDEFLAGESSFNIALEMLQLHTVEALKAISKISFTGNLMIRVIMSGKWKEVDPFFMFAAVVSRTCRQKGELVPESIIVGLEEVLTLEVIRSYADSCDGSPENDSNLLSVLEGKIKLGEEEVECICCMIGCDFSNAVSTKGVELLLSVIQEFPAAGLDDVCQLIERIAELIQSMSLDSCDPRALKTLT
jgi:hypothetical protein